MKLRVLVKRAVWAFVGLAVLIGLGVVIRGYFAFRDRLPGYALALEIDGKVSARDPKQLRVGFARVRINPDLSRTNRPVWVAGFSQNRVATGVHDDLWAVACVLDDGYTRLGMVSLDAIGFFHDDVVRVRQRLPADLKLSYTIITSTHNHSTPDLMGLWGPSYLRTGVNPDYKRQVIDACVSTLSAAVSNLVPARVAFHEIQIPPTNLVADTRPPEVFDSDVRVMHFVKAESDATIGSITTWGNHPETVWSRNTELTSDFCGYLRDGLENGVDQHGQKLAQGVGGVHMYINGAVGGLMSTTPKTRVTNPYTETEFLEPSHDKARAVGLQLVSRVLPRLQHVTNSFSAHAPLTIRARTVEVPLTNKGYLLAGFLGLLDRGYVKWMTLRTEVAAVRFGPAGIACVPGEIYPELVNGGAEAPEGADFPQAERDFRPIRGFMPGNPKFVFGLANDEIGYILPKTQWDERSPYTYGSKKGHYGEINSVGPDVAPVLLRALQQLSGDAIQAGASSAEHNPAAPSDKVEANHNLVASPTPGSRP